MFDFLKKNNKRKLRYANHTEDGTACCPKCQSTSLHVEYIEGTGVWAMGTASMGIGRTPVAGTFPGPVPSMKVSAENVLDGAVKCTCNNCDHQFLLGKK